MFDSAIEALELGFDRVGYVVESFEPRAVGGAIVGVVGSGVVGVSAGQEHEKGRRQADGGDPSRAGGGVTAEHCYRLSVVGWGDFSANQRTPVRVAAKRVCWPGLPPETLCAACPSDHPHAVVRQASLAYHLPPHVHRGRLDRP